MKYTWTLLLFFFIFSIDLSAQGGTASETDAKASKKVEDVAQTLRKVDTRDRLIIELTHDNWANKPNDVKVRWWNRGFNIFLMYDVKLFNSNNVSIAPGIGISTANVYMKNSIVPNDSMSTFIPIPDGIDYKKNKISTTTLDIPVELRFRTNPNSRNKTFKIAPGFRVGYQLNGVHKYKGEDLSGSGLDVFWKNKKIQHFNKFKYGPSFRVGYGNFNIFAFYSISTLFEADKGPGIHPFSVGFSFNSF